MSTSLRVTRPLATRAETIKVVKEEIDRQEWETFDKEGPRGDSEEERAREVL